MKGNVKTVRSYLAPVASFGDIPADKGHLHHETHYDEQGRAVREVKYFEDGSTDEVHEYTYDEKDRILEEKLYYALSESEDITRTSYDDISRTVEEVLYYGEEPADKTITQRDEHDHPLSIVRYDEEGEFMEKEVFEYHKPGLVKEHRFYDEQEELIKKETSIYNDQDEVVEQHIWSADQDELNQTVVIQHEPLKTLSEARDEEGTLLYTRTHELDAKGRILKLIHADAQGGRYQEQRNEYDDNDNLVMQEWVDGAGNLLRKQLFSFNENGQLQQETFFEPNPYQSKNTHYVIQYEIEFQDV